MGWEEKRVIVVIVPLMTSHRIYIYIPSVPRGLGETCSPVRLVAIGGVSSTTKNILKEWRHFLLLLCCGREV